jgi:hypothetical protein
MKVIIGSNIDGAALYDPRFPAALEADRLPSAFNLRDRARPSPKASSKT